MLLIRFYQLVYLCTYFAAGGVLGIAVGTKQYILIPVAIVFGIGGRFFDFLTQLLIEEYNFNH